MKNHWKLTLQKGAVREEVFFEKKLHCDANCEHYRAIISNLLWSGVIFENILNASLRGRTELGSCGISPSAARWVAQVPCNTVHNRGAHSCVNTNRFEQVREQDGPNKQTVNCTGQNHPGLVCDLRKQTKNGKMSAGRSLSTTNVKV